MKILLIQLTSVRREIRHSDAGRCQVHFDVLDIFVEAVDIKPLPLRSAAAV